MKTLHDGALLVIWFLPGIVAAEDNSSWIDLLKSLDPTVHTTAGRWQMTSDGLSTTAVAGARIAIPYQPQAEYDFRVRFTRTTGSNSIALVFLVGGQQATFDIDGWAQHLAGIQQIRGRDMRQYRDQVAQVTLRNGQAYTATVQVRKNQVSVYLDEKLLQSHTTDGSDLGLLELWKLPDSKTLGLGAWDSATTFHSVEIREVTGAPRIAAAPLNPPHRSLASGPSVRIDRSPDDIAALSDEFDDPDTLRDWRRIFQEEQTGADQLRRLDIGQTQSGWMTLVPHTSTWYQDYRGVLVYKAIEGDFVVTTRAHSTNRAGTGAPQSSYSLAGIMVRTPRDVTPRTWRPGGENYIFLSHGSARSPGRFEFEVKTTIDSRSSLEVSPAGGPDVIIQVARIGADFVLLRKDGGRAWEVHRRYRRSDMPRALQVGLTVYTDYSNASRLRPAQQNTQVIRGGQPDLRASFDYVRFSRPLVPADLQGRSLSDPSQVTDSRLLQFLGERAMVTTSHNPN